MVLGGTVQPGDRVTVDEVEGELKFGVEARDRETADA